MQEDRTFWVEGRVEARLVAKRGRLSRCKQLKKKATAEPIDCYNAILQDLESAGSASNDNSYHAGGPEYNFQKLIYLAIISFLVDLDFYFTDVFLCREIKAFWGEGDDEAHLVAKRGRLQ